MIDPARVVPADFLPQTGAMVLLDAVVSCDAERIECRTTTHRRRDHPLAHGGRLPAWAGVEYAAQAIALHLAFARAEQGRPRVGFLGALRDVACLVDSLDEIAGALVVSATRLFADGSGAVYTFEVRAEGRDAALLSGRATVMQR